MKNQCSVLCAVIPKLINTEKLLKVANAIVARTASKLLPIPLTRFTIGGKSQRRKYGLSCSRIVRGVAYVVLVELADCPTTQESA